MIPFNKPYLSKLEKQYIHDCLDSGKLCGDGLYTKRCSQWLEQYTGACRVLLTTSCTHGLEMAAMLLGFKPGDEVITPSYTFVSTANAFLLQGALPRFVDVEPRTMNMDPRAVANAITPKTRAIFVVHYAGVSCEMDEIMAIAAKHGIPVVEDAAQGVGSTYKGRPLGSIGALGCFSFHETKNFVMGEGGALVINDSKYVRQAEIIREKGTDRSRFIRGEVDKYTWQEIGSSYLPSDILAALLLGQLERFDEITSRRMAIWNAYDHLIKPLENAGLLRTPCVPDDIIHNAHMYYILLPNADERDRLLNALRDKGIHSAFHYIPLHTSRMGLSLGYKLGDLPVTEQYAGRLLRLPLYAGMTVEDAEAVAGSITELLKQQIHR